MAFLWQQGLTVVGNNDTKVSPYLKAWVKQNKTLVCGVVGEGTSKELVANWNSPFEEDTLGGKFQKVGAFLQQISDGTTSKTKLSSVQAWEGNRPVSFNLQLNFYALNDAKKEVMDPIKELEKMMSPQVLDGLSPIEFDRAQRGIVTGKMPQRVMINIGRHTMYRDCVITNMSEPLDAPVTSEGYLTKAEVTLQIETVTMKNKSEIDGTFG